MKTTEQHQWAAFDERAFSACRDEAVAIFADQIRPSLTPIWEAFGADAQKAAHADAGFHLDVLHTALACDQPETWLDSMTWLQQVLVSRGTDTELLVQSLEKLEALFAQQLPTSTRAAVCDLLSKAVQLLRSQNEEPADYGGKGPEAWEQCMDFQEALLAGDHSRSTALFEQALGDSGNLVSATVHVVQPALYDIGRKWQRNAVSVTQERLATTIVEAVLAQTSGFARPAKDSGLSILLARAPGNHHALGIRIVADAFEMAGWETHLLSGKASAETLLPLLREKQPQLLGFSAALPPHLLATRELLRQLREALGDAMPRVILGGLAVNQYPEIARAMGGDIIGEDAENLAKALANMACAA